MRIPIITAVIVVTLLAFISSLELVDTTESQGLLHVTFLDVGQGDATLIESPTGTQVLIDGGKNGIVIGELKKTIGFFDRDIDMLVATHPDMDHIGGLSDVLDQYDVATILMTENINDTPAFNEFRSRIEAEGARIIYARRGQIFDLGYGVHGSTTLSVLFPDHDPTNLESNMSSIVMQLEYGESTYIITGDSPQEIEEYLVKLDGGELESDILKLGHHGSKTSSAELFITAVAPIFGIISAGKENSYGHPHKEVVDRLSAHGVIQKNTADEGSIFSVSDGVRIWFR